MTGHISCRNLARSRASLRISFLRSPPPVPAFLLIDPISDMERTILELDPVRFAMGEKCYGVLVNERHVPQIEYQLLPRCLDDEQLLELPDILRLHSPTEGEHHLTVCRSLNSEHKSFPAWAVPGDAWPAHFQGFAGVGLLIRDLTISAANRLIEPLDPTVRAMALRCIESHRPSPG